MLKNLKLGTNKLKLDFKLFTKNYCLDATISTKKSTIEIDTDLAQNDM